MAAPLKVRVVDNEGLAWSGKATSVLVRTTEGDLGILSGHVPLMAALVPHGAEIVTPDGERLILAVDSGFISVFDNNVSVLSAYAAFARDISVDEAVVALAAMHERAHAGELDDAERRSYHRLQAQVKAAQKYAKIGDV